jgi:hypothetical protein
MNPLTFLFAFAGLALFILCWAWVVAELKFRKFNNDCIYIEALIKKRPVIKENYDYIVNQISKLNCTTDIDRRRKKSIWISLEYKFRDVSGHGLTEDQLLNIMAGCKEYIGSQEHFEDEINAYYDAIEEQNKIQDKDELSQIESDIFNCPLIDKDVDHAITGN